MLRSIKPKGRVIALFLCIPVIWYVFSVFVPLLTAVFYSLFEWKGGPKKTFIGLANYIDLIKTEHSGRLSATISILCLPVLWGRWA